MPVAKKTKKTIRSKVATKISPVLKPVAALKVSALIPKVSLPVYRLPAVSVSWRILAAGGLVIASLAFYQVTFAGRIYPGVAVGKFDLSGKTIPEAESILSNAWRDFSSQGIVLNLNEKSAVLNSLVTSPTDPDLTYQLLRFDSVAAAREAYQVGRQGSWLSKLVKPVIISFTNSSASQITADVELDRIIQYIRDSFPGAEQLPRQANLEVDLAGNLSVLSEVKGLVIDKDDLASNLNERLVNLNPQPIEIKLVPVTPTLSQTMVAGLLPTARQLLSESKLEFIYQGQTWSAEPNTWHRWLGVSLDEKTAQARLAFLPAQADEFFGEIEKEVNQPARDAKFEIRNGRVAVFQGSWQGREVQREQTLSQAFTAINSGSGEPVALVVDTTEPEITTAETNDLGISEIIGIGHSNFKGSPANRRHNIKVGADALNGLLVRPGEEFSLLQALLPVDADSGYLPELVIKGNRTIPEYGGGLCQIGTTTFRAALASGLDITARRNHSYRVVYYEPAGTDATIYDPAPDFKFKNDTPHTVLIQTRIEGDDLYFEFWGRPDGRKAEQTKPRIYNITPPPATKIIETEDLAPGEKKCTEKPHSGADAEFTYTVTYPNGEVKQEVFKSHYIPWQEVCLLGVPKGTLSQPEEENTTEPTPVTDSSTEATPLTQ